MDDLISSYLCCINVYSLRVPTKLTPTLHYALNPVRAPTLRQLISALHTKRKHPQHNIILPLRPHSVAISHNIITTGSKNGRLSSQYAEARPQRVSFFVGPTCVRIQANISEGRTTPRTSLTARSSVDRIISMSTRSFWAVSLAFSRLPSKRVHSRSASPRNVMTT